MAVLSGSASPAGDHEVEGQPRREQSLERSRRQIEALDTRIRERRDSDLEKEPLGPLRAALDQALLVCWLITESVYTVGELLTAVATSTGVALYLLTPVALTFQGKMPGSGAAGVIALSTLGAIGGFLVRSRRPRSGARP